MSTLKYRISKSLSSQLSQEFGLVHRPNCAYSILGMLAFNENDGFQIQRILPVISQIVMRICIKYNLPSVYLSLQASRCLLGKLDEDVQLNGRGLMDKASAYGAEDCGFKSHRPCLFLNL